MSQGSNHDRLLSAEDVFHFMCLSDSDLDDSVDHGEFMAQHAVINKIYHIGSESEEDRDGALNDVTSNQNIQTDTNFYEDWAKICEGNRDDAFLPLVKKHKGIIQV